MFARRKIFVVFNQSTAILTSTQFTVKRGTGNNCRAGVRERTRFGNFRARYYEPEYRPFFILLGLQIFVVGCVRTENIRSEAFVLFFLEARVCTSVLDIFQTPFL